VAVAPGDYRPQARPSVQTGDRQLSPTDVRMKSEVVERASEIMSRLDSRTEVVGIDKSNRPGAGRNRQPVGRRGKQVIIAGLPTDYIGRPFPPMPDLLTLAESITKTRAICVSCGNPAKHTQRLVESETPDRSGRRWSVNEARCRRCFEPSALKQTFMDFTRPKERSPAWPKTGIT
jgi:thymidine kinase